jgi:hypothetical protein
MISRGLRIVFVLLCPAALVASCTDDDWDRPIVCNGTAVRRCRTICDYWCYGGGYYGYYSGCSPVCWDSCSTSCYPSPAPAQPADAGPPIDAAAPAPTNDGSGVLCSPCAKTDDCQSGSVCIFPGGPRDDAGTDAGARGFCGQTCTTNPDCPGGFVCAQLGSVRQCLPTAGRCGS